MWNTHGYLSAQSYPNIAILTIYLVIYIFMDLIWGGLVLFNRDKILIVHVMLSATLIAVTYECFGDLLYYYLKNKYDTDSVFLEVSSCIMHVARATLARIVIIAIALGY
jgi:hypothetical protein